MAFEHFLNVTALLNRCRCGFFKMDDCSILSGGFKEQQKMSSLTRSCLTKYFEMLLQNSFDYLALEYALMLWHVSFYRIKQDLIAAGQTCGFTCLRLSHFYHTFSPTPFTLTISFSPSIFLLLSCPPGVIRSDHPEDKTLEIQKRVCVGVCVCLSA